MFRISMMLFFALIMIFFISCEPKPKPEEVKGFETYQDESLKFEIKYPSNWYVARKRLADRIEIYSSQVGMNRFRFADNYQKGLPSAKIALIAYKLDSDFNADSVFHTFKMFEDYVYSNPEKTTLDGVEAIKREYAFPLEDGNFQGEIYIATKDPNYATILILESFGNSFEEYTKTAFNEVKNSVKLAVTPARRVDTITVIQEAPFPSQTFKTVRGQGFTISIPDNFGSERARGAQDAIYSNMYIGERRGDCYIAVVIKDASKQKDLKKIVDETQKTIAGASAPVATTIGNEKGYYFTYNVKTKEGNVRTKLYFVLRGDKLYQIAQTWNTTKEEKEYLPVLEKAVNSIVFE